MTRLTQRRSSLIVGLVLFVLIINIGSVHAADNNSAASGQSWWSDLTTWLFSSPVSSTPPSSPAVQTAAAVTATSKPSSTPVPSAKPKVATSTLAATVKSIVNKATTSFLSEQTPQTVSIQAQLDEVNRDLQTFKAAQVRQNANLGKNIGLSISNAFQGFSVTNNSSSGGGGGGSGSVTSVDASGGTTGLSVSGGPITSTGLLTLGGVLNVANGGTGTSTTPSYGKLLLGNAAGGFDLVATSTIGLGGSSGTVSSVNASGGSTGLNFTGGAITSTGVLTLGGTLNVANGGTGWAAVVAGAIPYGNGAGALATTTTSAGNAGQVLSFQNGVPTWVATTTFGGGLSYSGGNVTLNTSNANTFGALQTFNSGVTIGSLTGPLQAVNGSVSASSTLSTFYGGTGLSTVGASSTVLVSNGTTNRYLSLSPANFTTNNISQWNNNSGYLTSLAGAASSTLLADTNTWTGANAFTQNITSSSVGSSTFAGGIDVARICITGTTNCLGAAVAGGVTSVSNADGTLTISPTTGSVVASLALSHANKWTGLQEFNAGASTTQASVYGSLYVGGTATTTIRGGNSASTLPYASTTMVTATTASTTNLVVSALGGTSIRCLQVASDGTIQANASACGTGGGSGSSSWATTTSSVAGNLVNYSINTTDIVAIGNTSTTTAKYWFDPNTQVAYLGGSVGIGTTTPGSILSIGNTNGVNFSTATTTFSSTGGINLAAGCFSLRGVCVGSGSGSGTVSGGVTGQLAFFGANGTTVMGSSTDSLTIGRYIATSTSASSFLYASTTVISSSANAYFATAGGSVGIGSTTPGSVLSIGNTNGINFSTATTTFSSTGGINLAAGCFSIAGTCVGGGTGSGSGTVSSGVAGQLAFYSANGTTVIGSSTDSLTIGRYIATSTNASSFLYASTTAFTTTGSAYFATAGGNVGIGTTSPGTLLAIGNTNGINFTTATTTFNSTGGINIASGCFAVAGTCVGNVSGSGSGTVSAGLAGQLAFYSANGTTVTGSSTQSLTMGQFFGTSTGASRFLYASTTALSSSGSAYFALNGSVGIGTTTPGALLYVQGTSDTKQFITRENSSQTANLAEFQEANGNIIARVNKTSMPFEVNAYQVDPNTNIIPDMTGATTPSGTASADSIFAAGSEAWQAFDSNVSTTHTNSWLTNVNHGIITYQFPSGHVVFKYTVTAITSEPYSPNSWTFEGSNNGSSWTTLDTETGVSSWVVPIKTYTFTNTTSYSYYRMNIPTSNDPNFVGVARLQMFESATVPSSALAVTTTGQIGINNATPLAQLHVKTNSATTKGFIIEGFSGQTADLQQWQSSSAVPLGVVTSAGNFGIGTSTPFSNAGMTIFNAGSTAAGSPQLVLSASTTVAGYSVPFLSNWAVGADLNDGGKFKIASSSVVGTNDRFVIDGNGRVGIGTSSPASTLTVTGAACFSKGAGATLACGSVAGDIYYGTSHTGAYDVAENYKTSDLAVEAGDIVALDPSQPLSVIKASYGANIFGAVSTQPGMVLGGSDASMMNSSSTRPIALSGRVPVKVNNQGGAIVIGDPITVSSVPGIGKKARGTEEQLGTALEAYSGSGTGTIDVFVSTKQKIDQNQFVIDTSGNVGIGGTTSPAYKLQVNGDVAATSFVNISTRDAKNSISYLDETAKQSILNQIQGLNIAQYRYNTESSSDPLRLGLIAEEAPAQVLAVGGKGVDVYKLSTFILAGVQEQQKQITAIKAAQDAQASTLTVSSTSTAAIAPSTIFDLSGITKAQGDMIADIRSKADELAGRVDALASTTSILAATVSGFSTTLASLHSEGASAAELASSTTFIQSLVGAVQGSINHLGSIIIDSMTAHIVTADLITTNKLTVGNLDDLAASGITVLDRANGQPQCVFISNGSIQISRGTCGTGTVASPLPQAPVTTPAPTVSETPSDTASTTPTDAAPTDSPVPATTPAPSDTTTTVTPPADAPAPAPVAPAPADSGGAAAN